MAAFTTITLATLAAAASATGAVMSGIAAKDAASFNSAVAKQNARTAQTSAAAEAMLLERRKRRIIGTQLATMSAAGIDITSATADDIIYDTALSAEMDKLSLLYKGDVEATNYRSAASLASFQGKSAYIGGMISAGGSILSGAASASASGGGTQPTFSTAPKDVQNDAEYAGWDAF